MATKQRGAGRGRSTSLRFVRVFIYGIISIAVIAALDTLPHINIEPQYQIMVTTFGTSFLTAFDKFLRDNRKEILDGELDIE